MPVTVGWTVPTPNRSEPHYLASEREALEEWLEYHRSTLVTKCAGLSEDDLKRRAVAPSGLSLLGLVRHMADVERWWFRMNAAGEDLPFRFSTDAHPDADFDDVDVADARADLAAYEEECRAATDAVRGRSLDDVVASRGHHPERTRNVRWIYLHMIEESCPGSRSTYRGAHRRADVADRR